MQQTNAYIDELIFDSSKITEKTILFYESLGLSTVKNKKTVTVFSTRIARIISFGAGMELSISNSHCGFLKKKNILTDLNKRTTVSQSDESQSDNLATFYMVYDDIGTGIKIFPRKSPRNISIGVLTSGGDAPGMNAAVRSIIRSSLKQDIKVYGIYKGFEGLITNDIRKLNWDSETHQSGQGGTILLSARSEKFRTKEGRKEAAFNLFIRGITSLIVIGGEGSMTGAMVLKEEFKEHCKELLKEQRIQKYLDEKKMNSSSDKNTGSFNDDCLNIEHLEDLIIEYEEDNDDDASEADTDYLYDLDVVGIPGTIDNDVVGVDLTLGGDSALTRVMEVVERLNTTMRSHSTVFILECMGRNCGWITLMAGFAVDADYIIVPEKYDPEWKQNLVDTVKTAYYNGKENIFVFLSEGARDAENNKITISEIESLISHENIRVRGLTIGHIQRGGKSSAVDNILGTLLGMKAVECIISKPEMPFLVGKVNGEIRLLDLKKIVDDTVKSHKLYENNRLEELYQIRDLSFQRVYDLYENHRKELVQKYFKENPSTQDEKVGLQHQILETKMNRKSFLNESILQYLKDSDKKSTRIGLLFEGISSGGMNTVLNSVVQICQAKDYEIFYFFDGFNGLKKNRVRNGKIYEFSLSHNDNGVAIGSSEINLNGITEIEKKVAEFKLDYLIVGGTTKTFEIAKNIKNFVIIPCSVDNNFPFTSNSIGSNTALNSILQATETCKTAVKSMKKKVFMLEIGGQNSGFLTIMGGIASSAFEVIYPEDCHMADLILIRKKIKDVSKRQRNSTVVIFRNHNTFDKIKTDDLCKLLCYNTDCSFDYSVLGYFETGSAVSPMDRINARLASFKAIEICEKKIGSGLVSTNEFEACFIPINDVLNAFDQENNIPKQSPWLALANVCSQLE